MLHPDMGPVLAVGKNIDNFIAPFVSVEMIFLRVKLLEKY